MHTDAHPPQEAARATIRRTGLAVIVLGAIQLVLGLVPGADGGIRLHVVGLAFGLLIRYGSPRMVALVRWLAIFALAGWIVEPFKTLLLAPVGLAFAQLRLMPGAVLMDTLPMLLPAAIVAVIAFELSRPDVMAAQVAAGRRPSSGRLPLMLGLALTLGAVGIEYYVLNGVAARHASQLAAHRFGTGYQYTTKSLSMALGEQRGYRATVQAWNDKEVRLIPVQWH
jgi:hypothetical protein